MEFQNKRLETGDHGAESPGFPEAVLMSHRFLSILSHLLIPPNLKNDEPSSHHYLSPMGGRERMVIVETAREKRGEGSKVEWRK